ncbi:trypsin-like peptidase domain-containing protein [Fluviicola taffensis]|uniref:trypsin-like serine peptidase n=1 Tax=Fluviicola taffensis TaxID=191579 RepID=UPI003137A716
MKTIEYQRRNEAMANDSLREFENSFTLPPETWGGISNETQESISEQWLENASMDQTENHIEESLELARSLCGRDERQRVDPTIYPHRFICRLIITAKNGMQYFGSGFFISPRCIITSGHCVHFDPIDGGRNYDWARSIQVIPGADGEIAPFGSQISTTFRTVSGWAVDRDSNFDHGAIILPDETLYQRVNGFLGVKELTEREILINVGYPADKGGDLRGTAWGTMGPVSYINDYKIAYMLDTYGGNSGSPVFVRNGDTVSVVGVHGYGSCPNHCVKVRDAVLQRWNEWTQL